MMACTMTIVEGVFDRQGQIGNMMRIDINHIITRPFVYMRLCACCLNIISKQYNNINRLLP